MRARENPFRSERLGALAFQHPALSVDAIGARLDGLGRRAAIVGPHGSGKTTLLRALARRFERDGLCVHHAFVTADVGPPPTRALVEQSRTLGSGDVLLFDGASHLSRSAWWRLRRAARAAGGLVVTSHTPGLLPTLITTAVDASLAHALARELLGPAATGLHVLLDELRTAHDGNLHAVFLALYDLVAHDDARVAAIAGSLRPAA